MEQGSHQASLLLMVTDKIKKIQLGYVKIKQKLCQPCSNRHFILVEGFPSPVLHLLAYHFSNLL